VRLRRSRARCLASLLLPVLVIVLGNVVPLVGQRRAERVEQHPGWLPRRVDIRGSITPAEKAEAIRKLEAIESIFRRVPELANPDTIMVEPILDGGCPIPVAVDCHDQAVGGEP